MRLRRLREIFRGSDAVVILKRIEIHGIFRLIYFFVLPTNFSVYRHKVTWSTDITFLESVCPRNYIDDGTR